MQRSDDIGQLAAALAAAQGKMKPAGMNAVNPFLKNTYADLGAVIEAIRPCLEANGLSFTQLPETGDGTVTLETVIMHSSGQWISSVQAVSVDAEKGLSSAQITGKAITYLRRYALSAMFGVYADKDEDGNDHVDPETGEIRPRRLQPAPKGTRPQAVATRTVQTEPRTPEQLREHLRNSAHVNANEPELTVGWRDGLIGTIDKMTEPDGHHAFLTWAFDSATGSRKDITNGQLHALKGWLQTRSETQVVEGKDGQREEKKVWVLNEIPAAELLAAYPVALAAAMSKAPDFPAPGDLHPASAHLEPA